MKELENKENIVNLLILKISEKTSKLYYNLNINIASTNMYWE